MDTKGNHTRDETSEQMTLAQRQLRTPRAAAIAGIIFSVLLTVSLALIRSSIPSSPSDAGGWLSDSTRAGSVALALNLIPFAGIAFLWFIGVVRDRIGPYEDRFFASVFLGSGLLFVAMIFGASAMAIGMLALASRAPGSQISLDVWRVGRATTYTLMTTYAMRMAAVFTISTTAISLRIGFMPRWMAGFGYACALVLLLGVGFVAWLELAFPIWVFIVSVYILYNSFRQKSPVTSLRGSDTTPTSG